MPPVPAAFEEYGAQAESFVRDALTMGGATLAAAPIASLFLSLMLYSFVGWLWESTFCTYVNERRFANSGFLLGPCCPIYGAGVLVCWLVLRSVANPVLQFLAAGGTVLRHRVRGRLGAGAPDGGAILGLLRLAG